MSERNDNTPTSEPKGDPEREAWLEDQVAELQEREAAAWLDQKALAENEAEKAFKEWRDHTIQNLLDRTPGVDPENPTFEDLRIPVTDAPVEPKPCILTRDDGASVLYAQRFSSLHGEPGCGKSWIALIAAGEAVKRGGRCLWLDAEDRPHTLAERARPLGRLDAVTDPDRFRFVTSADLVDIKAVTDQALAWLLTATAPTYSLVVIDSAESWGCPSDGASVRQWIQRFVEPWRQCDIGIVVLDHIPKRKESRPPGAIGSQHKRAAVDGASFRLSGKPWTKKAGGAITLINEKDRAGDLPAGIGKAVATLAGSWGANGGFEWKLSKPKTESGIDEETVEAVYTAIKGAGVEGIHGARKLQEATGIRGSEAREAVAELVKAGRIIKEQSGRAFLYRVASEDEEIPLPAGVEGEGKQGEIF